METQIPPIALITKERDPRDYVRGINSQIVPTVNVPSGNWLAWLPTNEPQKFKFDSDECSQLSAINICETQCNWLKYNNKFSQEALDFFNSNGYIDSNGSFAFSERFIGILSGTSINGNTITAFWDTVRKNGLLPRNDLNYTLAQSQQFLTQEAMCGDYYDKGYITQAMKDKALKSLSYIQVQYEWVSDIVTALKQAPIQIGIPVCVDNWNQTNVPFCPSTVPAHCVEVYADNIGFYIRDQYAPYNKVLDKSYFIPQIIMGVITAVPISEVPNPPENVTIQKSFLDILKEYYQLLLSIFNRKN